MIRLILILSVRPGLSWMVTVLLTWTCTILYGPLVLLPNFLGFHFSKYHLLGSIIIASFLVFSWIRCSLLCVIVCQSAINGMLRNMSLLNTRLPGLLSKVECTPACMACMQLIMLHLHIVLHWQYFAGGYHVIVLIEHFSLFGASFHTQH